LRHPSIIEFFAAYSLGNCSTFIFAPAESDLHDWMRKGVECVWSVSEILDGLRGLCSALCHMHNYFLGSEDVQKIGCHYDIHPRNILVKNHSMILSDFGLSRLKTLDQGSRSGFVGGVLDYYAPECQDWARSFKKGQIGRPSDIWSLGCIMAEIVTFMVQGSAGLEAFDKQRTYGPFSTFHATGAEHDKVTQWIRDLAQKTSSGQVRELASLIETMLYIDQQRRPAAWDVLSRVTYLFHQTTYDTVLGHFEKLTQNTGYNFEIEFERFKIWSEHVGLAQGNQDSSCAPDVYLRRDHDILESVTDQLKSILSILSKEVESSDQTRDDTGNRILYTELRIPIDKLWYLEESSSQHIMARKLESIILGRSPEAALNANGIDRFARPQLLLVIQQALKTIDEMQQVSPSSLLVEHTRITQFEECEEYSLGQFTTTDGDQHPSITELYYYDDAWIDRAHELVTRVQNLVLLLGRDDIVSNFPVLRALAFYHIPERQAYGLIFEMPTSIDIRGTRQAPQTLVQVIKRASRRAERPSLDDVYALAYRISNTILSFHKARWLHKSISAYKVIVFPQNETATPECLPSARLLGFQYSRATDDSFTVGPPKAKKAARYRHPQYHEGISRFEERFDYYSLGIVLLELGRWKTLDSMLKNTSPLEIKQYLLQEVVPDLRSHMGVGYHHAVRVCLEGFDTQRGLFDRLEVWKTFEKEVLSHLATGLVIPM
jgi:serine/threonine protein kinase